MFISFSKRACRRQFLLGVMGLLNWGLFALLLHKFVAFDLKVVNVLICMVLTWLMTRRCHDMGRSAIYCLIPGYIFILLFKDGDVGTNAWGMDRKYEYTPQDFEDLEVYYRWRNKRPVFRKPLIVAVIKRTICGALLLTALMGIDSMQDFMQYETTCSYYDMECSQSIRFYLPEGVEIGSCSINDIMFLETGEESACIYEDADGEYVCGVLLTCDASDGFGTDVWRQMKDSAELTENVKYSKYAFIKKYLSYFER